MGSVKTTDELVNQIGEMSVLELADVVKALEEKFGVSGAVQMSSASVPASVEEKKEDEAAEVKVTLVAGGSEKIKMIKALRKIKPNLNLTDAKKMVEEAPVIVEESIAREKAAEIKKTLEEAGGTVEFK